MSVPCRVPPCRLHLPGHLPCLPLGRQGSPGRSDSCHLVGDCRRMQRLHRGQEIGCRGSFLYRLRGWRNERVSIFSMQVVHGGDLLHCWRYVSHAPPVGRQGSPFRRSFAGGGGAVTHAILSRLQEHAKFAPRAKFPLQIRQQFVRCATLASRARIRVPHARCAPRESTQVLPEVPVLMPPMCVCRLQSVLCCVNITSDSLRLQRPAPIARPVLFRPERGRQPVHPVAPGHMAPRGHPSAPSALREPIQPQCAQLNRERV